jgi:hypothetical protein
MVMETVCPESCALLTSLNEVGATLNIAAAAFISGVACPVLSSDGDLKLKVPVCLF